MKAKILRMFWLVLVFGVVAISIRYGLLRETYEIDGTGISWGIMALFSAAMGLAFFSTLGANSRAALRVLKDLANLQVFVGLFGTVVGLYMIFSTLGVTGEMENSETTAIVMGAVPHMLMAFWTSILGMAGGGLTILTYVVLGGEDGV